ncbi:class I SAM-dependent methyltransferase [Enterobacter mori]|uniref:class I SAM-dependent methyltransferase n=1 Tax=Enterobacter mori TaxID=539813 RepID=UPI0022369CC8|nr:class I SAM-dependent methyltransferase [Enterobacter mori]MCW4986264.1 class I SAM-dependent methyltransferase [Enterobacter mori]
MKRFSQEIKSGLVWLPELGMGRYPVPKDRPYDADYFSRYQEMADTDLGRELTAARIRLVARHYTGPVLDVGIGAGQFVTARPETKGYDVNPAGVEWLKERGAWANLYRDRFPALTFWDSLEHIDRPDVAVARAEQWVFVSVPIFSGAEHVIRSRHFRRDEHIWYWTHDGLVAWFGEQGFELVEHNRLETVLGREGIGSYAFARVE